MASVSYSGSECSPCEIQDLKKEYNGECIEDPVVFVRQRWGQAESLNLFQHEATPRVSIQSIPDVFGGKFARSGQSCLAIDFLQILLVVSLTNYDKNMIAFRDKCSLQANVSNSEYECSQ